MDVAYATFLSAIGEDVSIGRRDMIRSSSDFRLLALVLLADGAEVAGSLLRNLCHRASRSGRLQRALQDLEHGDLVARAGEGTVDERLFRITDQGRRALTGGVDPQGLWSRRWDGQWRLVLFDVPQSKSAMRERLRRTLHRLRFGWLQNSVWISPDPVPELTQRFHREHISVESLVFLTARPSGGETDAELVDGAWDWSRIGRMHSSYLKVARLHPSRRTAMRLPDWLDWLQTERRAWQLVCREDPFLPDALLPGDYAGREVWAAHQRALQAGRHALGRLVARL